MDREQVVEVMSAGVAGCTHVRGCSSTCRHMSALPRASCGRVSASGRQPASELTIDHTRCRHLAVRCRDAARAICGRLLGVFSRRPVARSGPGTRGHADPAFAGSAWLVARSEPSIVNFRQLACEPASRWLRWSPTEVFSLSSTQGGDMHKQAPQYAASRALGGRFIACVIIVGP
jgi:hypothetical protein